MVVSAPAGQQHDVIRAKSGSNPHQHLGQVLLSSADVADEYWAAGLSPSANLKRFKAIRAGLLQNLNETVAELTKALKRSDVREVQFQLGKLGDKWKRIEALQRSIVQLMADDNLDGLAEEARLFEDNRDVVDRHRDQANEFLLTKKQQQQSPLPDTAEEHSSSPGDKKKKV